MKTKEFTIKLKNYYDVYCGKEDVAIKSAEELPGNALGIKLVFFSPAGTASNFPYQPETGISAS